METNRITGVITRSVMEDASSPYFLHQSDSPGAPLVSQPLTATGDNYDSWSREMTIALNLKNKLGFVDGSIVKPQPTETDLLTAWVQNNNVVISWILNSVVKEISARLIHHAASAKAIWEDLRNRYQQYNGPRIFQLKKELMNLSQGDLSVKAYFAKLKVIWKELSNYRPTCTCSGCSCGGVNKLNSHHEVEYVMSFLMGLNDRFSHALGHILLMDPIPPISTVFNLIKQEEKQQKVKYGVSDSSNSMAIAVKSADVNQGTKNGQGNSKGKKDKRYCSHCNTWGHTAEVCCKLIKQEEKQQKVKYGASDSNNSMAIAVKSADVNQGTKNGQGNSKGKKDKRYCSHCNTRGHTAEVCYKLHGYPPANKQKSKDNSQPIAVNQPDSTHLNFLSTLNANQCQQLMVMLSNHMLSNTNTVTDTSTQLPILPQELQTQMTIGKGKGKVKKVEGAVYP